MINSLKKYNIIFWDFDGVIKESVEIKGIAFKRLFHQFGDDIVNKIEKHHLNNGGISRYEKIPLYLNWAGIVSDNTTIERYANDFSKIVIKAVVDSNWVDGVKEYILNNYNNQKYFLLTATPQEEIEIILNKLEIINCFENIYGSPNKKEIIINKILSSNMSKKSVMIGDSKSDYSAALMNKIDFILRCTPLNLDLQKIDNIKKFTTLNE
jgi:HAD superfamily hydrolase (TIGR01549 family)